MEILQTFLSLVFVSRCYPQHCLGSLARDIRLIYAFFSPIYIYLYVCIYIYLLLPHPNDRLECETHDKCGHYRVATTRTVPLRLVPRRTGRYYPLSLPNSSLGNNLTDHKWQRYSYLMRAPSYQPKRKPQLHQFSTRVVFLDLTPWKMPPKLPQLLGFLGLLLQGAVYGLRDGRCCRIAATSQRSSGSCRCQPLGDSQWLLWLDRPNAV